MATIRDVARKAGVSVSTVSRVLNEPQIVVAAKRELVEKAIADLNFKPSRAARSLNGKSFQTIALIVTDISNIFFAEIASAIEGQCAEKAYSVLLCNLDNREERLERFLADFPQIGVDGVIICGGAYLDKPRIDALLHKLVDKGIPLVFSGQHVGGLGAPSVINDNAGAISQVIEHLLERQRKRVAYIGGPPSAIARERSDFFRSMGREQGLSIDDALVTSVPNEFEAGQIAAAELLARDGSIDAIVCGSDQIAIGAMKSVRAAGKMVPSDVSVVGFDDTSLARYAEPALTSVSVNTRIIGTIATAKLVDAIDGANGDTEPTLVPCQLVVRSSS